MSCEEKNVLAGAREVGVDQGLGAAKGSLCSCISPDLTQEYFARKESEDEATSPTDTERRSTLLKQTAIGLHPAGP